MFQIYRALACPKIHYPLILELTLLDLFSLEESHQKPQQQTLEQERSTSNLHKILLLSSSCWHFANSQVIKAACHFNVKQWLDIQRFLKEIVKIACSKEVLRYLSVKGVSWKFIVKKSPWWGGLWEKLIRSVKWCIKKSIGWTIISHNELNTLLVDCGELRTSNLNGGWSRWCKLHSFTFEPNEWTTSN